MQDLLGMKKKSENTIEEEGQYKNGFQGDKIWRCIEIVENYRKIDRRIVLVKEY